MYSSYLDFPAEKTISSNTESQLQYEKETLKFFVLEALGFEEITKIAKELSAVHKL